MDEGYASPLVSRDANGVALVMSRSLVKIGVEEETGLVDDLLDATSDGGLLAVDVEDVHEDRNHHRILAGKRILSFLDLADAAVDRAQHGLRIGGKFTGRIAEELNAKDKEDEREEGEEVPVEKPEHGRDGERADDEGAPFTGEEGMRIDSRVQFDLRRELVESAPILMKKAVLCADFG